jgi:hypothetical protein
LQDTSNDIRHKHYEIILDKSPQERFLMALQMMDDVREIVLNSIRNSNKEISETDIKIEFMKRYYKNDFTQQQMEDIVKWFKSKSQIS